MHNPQAMLAALVDELMLMKFFFVILAVIRLGVFLYNPCLNTFLYIP